MADRPKTRYLPKGRACGQNAEPQRVQEQNLMGVGQQSPEAESFFNGTKVKDLNEKQPQPAPNTFTNEVLIIDSAPSLGVYRVGQKSKPTYM